MSRPKKFCISQNQEEEPKHMKETAYIVQQWHGPFGLESEKRHNYF